LSASTNSINLTDPNNSQQASSIQYPVSSIQIRATFFVLGWIAKHLPDLVREIHTRGHEVASHGYYHNLGNQQSPDALKRDLSDSKKLLEDIIGAPVYGYRAPSFFISNDILNTIADAGYLYDSSFNSFGMHGRYGHVKLSQNGKRGIALPISAIPASRSPSVQAMAGGRNPESSQGVSRKSKTQNPESKIFYELPISNIKLGSSILPWGGGAYFRLIPFPLFKLGVKNILQKEEAYLLHLHPWEFDPNQPIVKNASTVYNFRHCVNLDKTETKLMKLIEGFNHCQFITCSNYLEMNVKRS
jgi:polysaccharide deacetylase family protein (PEP-CTERM system associated)